MQELSGFPYFEVQFTKHGTVHDEREVAEVRDCLAQQPVTDLFVIAHGWNNDLNDARGLFRAFFARVREVVDSGLVPGVSTRRFAVLGVLWPSKKFAERDLIPSGAATAQSPVSDEALREQLEEIKGTFDAPDADVKLEQAKRLIRDLDDSKRARQEFVDLLRGLLPPEAADEEDASDRFFALPEEEVMQRLSRPVLPSGGAMTSGAGGAASMGSVGTLSRPPAGGAARLGQFFAGVKSAARNLINYVTYYEMKERAGTVGRDGVAPVLHAIRALRPDLKIHLIGHSFGGRLVTAAAAGQESQAPIRVDTMTLLQAAFSHHGFAHRYDGTHDGFFRRVVSDQRVSGPILITCTPNDRAVGLAYPIAS